MKRKQVTHEDSAQPWARTSVKIAALAQNAEWPSLSESAHELKTVVNAENFS